jgi:hypothetical protein
MLYPHTQLPYFITFLFPITEAFRAGHSGRLTWQGICLAKTLDSKWFWTLAKYIAWNVWNGLSFPSAFFGPLPRFGGQSETLQTMRIHASGPLRACYVALMLFTILAFACIWNGAEHQQCGNPQSFQKRIKQDQTSRFHMFPYVSTLLSQIRSVPTCSDNFRHKDLRSSRSEAGPCWPAVTVTCSAPGFLGPNCCQPRFPTVGVFLRCRGAWVFGKCWRVATCCNVLPLQTLEYECCEFEDIWMFDPFMSDLDWTSNQHQLELSCTASKYMIYAIICPKEKMIHCFTDGVSVDVSLGVELLPSWARNGQLRSASGKAHV